MQETDDTMTFAWWSLVSPENKGTKVCELFPQKVFKPSYSFGLRGVHLENFFVRRNELMVAGLLSGLEGVGVYLHLGVLGVPRNSTLGCSCAAVSMPFPEVF